MDSPQQRPNGAASKSFDELLPDADPGHQTEEGMSKAFSSFECDICGRRTFWIHYKMAVYLCSHDCLSRYRKSHQGAKP